MTLLLLREEYCFQPHYLDLKARHVGELFFIPLEERRVQTSNIILSRYFARSNSLARLIHTME